MKNIFIVFLKFCNLYIPTGNAITTHYCYSIEQYLQMIEKGLALYNKRFDYIACVDLVRHIYGVKACSYVMKQNIAKLANFHLLISKLNIVEEHSE